MSATINGNGLQIETLEEIQAAISVLLQAAFGAGIRLDLESSFGQFKNTWSELESVQQQKLLEVYNSLDFRSSEKVQLERLVPLLGVTKDGAEKSRVIGTATGTPVTDIPNGTTIEFDTQSTRWLTVDGPYTIGGGGTVVITIEAVENGPKVVTFSSDWTIIDTVPGFDSFDSTSQPVIGQEIETDAALRSRSNIEAFSRAQGPQEAIRAAITQVDGATFVGVFESQALSAADTDSDGIPARSINAVVEGGTDADVAAALERSRGAGIRLFGLDDGTRVQETILKSNGSTVFVEYNRVNDVEIWIEAAITVTTDINDPPAPADVTDQVEAVLLAEASNIFGIGDDVIPYKLICAVNDSGIPGIDDIVITLSFDDGDLDPFSTTKRVITIRERSAFDAARITATVV